MKILLEQFPTKIDRNQASDTGMAMVLILLLVGYFSESVVYFHIAIPVLIINMTFPIFFKPVAVIWFGLSHIIGGVVSRILLTLVFTFVVVPIGFLRKLLGKDSLFLKKWKQGSSSVLLERNKTFTPEDLTHPF